MMTKRLIVKMITAVIVAFLPVNLHGIGHRDKEIADSLSCRLEIVETPQDSLELLCNIFDLSHINKRDSIGQIIIETALRSNESAVGLDILRDLAQNHLRSDSLLAKDYNLALKFPESQDKYETMTFVRMMTNINKVRYSKPDEKEHRVRTLLKQISISKGEDIYDNIVTLHAICLYIGESSQGELLSKYIDRLDVIISKLNHKAYSIRHCFLAQASKAYRENLEHINSIACDRELIALLDTLESNNIRKYRNFNGERYTTYTRLLSNYPRLKPCEVENYYKNAMLMVERDSLAANSNRISMRPQIYYAMYNRNYAEALELLKKYIDYPYNAGARRTLLRMMVRSAEEVGDIDALLTASRDYNEILEMALEQRTHEKSKELQILYDVNVMKAEHARETHRMQHRMLYIATLSAIIFLVLLIIMAWQWKQKRKLVQNLADVNAALTAESANLRQSQTDLIKACDDARHANKLKTEFIRNLGNEVTIPLHVITEYTNLIIDCSEAEFKPYLKHFAHLVTINSEIISTIANDVLSLSEIDNNTISVNIKKESLSRVCKSAIEMIKHRAKPGVPIEIPENLPDISINTDSRRLLQILIQLLLNSIKFTEQGKITLSYSIVENNEKESNVEISVTDTGIGISKDNAERIFDRFVKLDRTTQGVGIGLLIARRLAEFLGGNVKLDTDYTDGARFVITLPVK